MLTVGARVRFVGKEYGREAWHPRHGDLGNVTAVAPDESAAIVEFDRHQGGVAFPAELGTPAFRSRSHKCQCRATELELEQSPAPDASLR